MTQLKHMSSAELEELYAQEVEVQVPVGRFRGRVLQWIDSTTANSPLIRVIDTVGFKFTPFGVDFTDSCWYFWNRRVTMGKFKPSPGPSRWRDTNTLRLTYEESRLPTTVRQLLYDEVKPLGPWLCLGIGGINRGPGKGEHFFFGLERIDPRRGQSLGVAAMGMIP